MKTPPDRTGIAGYKPHIDGLRAVSIAAVLAFHAGMPGVGGGFVGVDIFFVISGYLIINQIIAAIEDGRFSLWDFYARRALRIFPPYLIVLVATVAIGVVMLRSPRDLDNFVGSVGAAPLFLTNIYFMRRSGYFDVGAHERPLLHTWSLAVEEQFYLVAPLALLGIFWLIRRRNWSTTKALLLAGGLIGLPSLIGAILLTPPDNHPIIADRNPAFFMTQWRAWQFVAGGAIALTIQTISWRPRLTATVAGLLGAVLLALSIGLIGLEWLGVRIGYYNRVSGYPGYAAILPTLGAVLIIGSGLIDANTPVARLLSLRPMLFVGRISYALYLWHWPLLVFGHMLPVDMSQDAISALALGLAFVLAVLTHYAIERPVGNWRLRPLLRTDRRLALRVVAVGVIACAIVAGASHLVTRKALVAADANPILAKTRAVTVHGSGPCLSASAEAMDACLNGTAQVGILLGDSHAFALEPRIAYEAESSGVRLISLAVAGCSPLTLMQSRAKALAIPFCVPMVEKLDRLAPRIAAETDFAILESLWTATIHDAGPDHAAEGEEKLRRLFSKEMDLFSDKQRVLVIGPVPQLRVADPFSCVDLSQAVGLSTDRCAVPREEIEAKRASTVAILREVVARHPNARFVDPIDVVCDKTMCSPLHDGAITYLDYSHLNDYGALLLFESFSDDFEWAFHG